MSRVVVGANPTIDDGATVGYQYDDDAGPTLLGANARIRSGTKIYADVDLGRDFTTGHDALVREHTVIGDDVVLGTQSVLDGSVTVGDEVSIQTGVYVPPESEIGNRVFCGPNAVLTNDPYPLRREEDLEGPTLRDGVSVGANATILPGVTVGKDAFIAAGAVVSEDVPPGMLAMGVPADHRPLPEELAGENVIA